MSAVGNLDGLLCGATLASLGFHVTDNVHAVNNLAENYVLVIQPRGLDCADEELRAIGVRASVCHRQGAGVDVLQGEVLILEFVAVNGFAASTVASSEISSLAHEVGDDAVEGGALEAKALLTGAEGTEILGRARHHI